MILLQFTVLGAIFTFSKKYDATIFFWLFEFTSFLDAIFFAKITHLDKVKGQKL